MTFGARGARRSAPRARAEGRYSAANSSSSFTLTCPGAWGVPTADAGAWLIHSVMNRNALAESRNLTWVVRFFACNDGLSAVQAGSVIDAGRVLPLAPYTWTVMPGVEEISLSAPTRCPVFRSSAIPSAILGATAGLTCAVQPVADSPSI